MLGSGVEGGRGKSATLPRMDGLDEEQTLEVPFELMTIVTSCPDLSLIPSSDEEERMPPNGLNSAHTDALDGRFFKHSLTPAKTPLGLRRSTSLNSLEADGYGGEGGCGVDGNVGGVLGAGAVSQMVGQLEKTFKPELGRSQTSTDFLRSTQQRSSYTGPGFFHKSLSTPSVQWSRAGSTGVRKGASAQSVSSSKRSFFRRKQKGKTHPHPPTAPHRNGRMNGGVGGEEGWRDSLGEAGLADPSLAILEPDIECWTQFMAPNVPASLTDKQVKRQEHMYELIQTEKHHCLTMALMQHLFVGGMRREGYTRQARLLFPALPDLLQVHFDFLRRLREEQMRWKVLDEPLESVAGVLAEQFGGERWERMVRLYGLLCSSLETSFELFKTLKGKDTKFAALVASWAKEPLLGRKNVSECLLLVGQRITKYPLLIEPLVKTSERAEERSVLQGALASAKNLNAAVNERVAERERLSEMVQRLEAKSGVVVGGRRLRREELLSLPTRRLLFTGQALVSGNNLGGTVAALGVHILTDSLLFTQELSGRLSFAPPGMIHLNHLIVRENAGSANSLYLVLVTGAIQPEMIQLQVTNPRNRTVWMEAVKEAKGRWEEETELCSDAEEDLTEALDQIDPKTSRALEELHEQDGRILALLKARSKLMQGLRTEKPTHSFPVKEPLLNALALATTEVQRAVQEGLDSGPNSVNRSASCVSGHVGSTAALPRRADTFGGFDSQQRSALDLSQTVNSRVLFQMVVQLAEVCGELFEQLVPSVMPGAYQSHHQVQCRMEELREAQQRLEADKAHWHSTLALQKEEAERRENQLRLYKDALTKQEQDISQQREQLYRKLEKLEVQGIRPLLDSVSVSPLSVNTNLDKGPVGLGPRRSPSQSSLVTPTPSAHPSTAPPPNKLTKQQLPLHLASSLAKASTPPDPSSSLPRSSSVHFPTRPSPHLPSPPPSELTRNSSLHASTRPPTNRGSAPSQSSSVQQMLPLRLSEGLAARTSSLPRGLASKSATNVLSQPTPLPDHQSFRPTQKHAHLLHASKSSGSLLSGAQSEAQSSYLHGPSVQRMSSYYRDVQRDPPAEPYRVQGPPAGGGQTPPYARLEHVHRRSGSSPVPMSSNNPFYQSQQEDTDSTKILFI